MSEKIFKCDKCNYTTKKNYNLKRHVKQVHSCFFKQCVCGKKYTTKSGYKRHIKKCYEILKNDLLKLQEKESVQNITNNTNTTNISINLFLNKYCSKATNLTDFIDNLKYSLEDVMNTYNSGYTNGITNVVLKGLEDMPMGNRPIHCTNKKEGKLFIRDNNQWEEDNVTNKGKAYNIISKMRKKQYLALQEWDKAHPNWEKDEKLSVMRCKILNELLGDSENVEKNMKKILKDVSKQIPLKPL
tara:strand:+ start:1314 stop:2042 length:729 start_codon:yes stop_codon:yes gene_type:complete